MTLSDSADTIERPVKSQRTSRNAARVLIVSDEKALRTLVRSTLAFDGCRCAEAETLDAARRLRRAKTFDIAVVDGAILADEKPTQRSPRWLRSSGRCR